MTLSELKLKLDALPARQKIANQGQLFSRFWEKTNKARMKAAEAVTAARCAKLAVDNFDDKEVVERAKRAGRRAARLHKKLSADSAAIVEPDVQNYFALLIAEADAAYSECVTAWTASVQSKLAGRAALADVLAKVLPQEGGEMRKTVSALEQTAGRLPLSESQALRVRGLLGYFDELMNKIGLSDEVGEFLREVASPNGATLTSLQRSKVQSFLDDHDLRGVFRIRLQ